MLKEYFKFKSAEYSYKAQRFIDAAGIEMSRRFEAAGFGRRLDKQDRRTRGPVIETLDSLARLRGFSRDLTKNNPYARRAISVRSSNTIGTGIKPAFRGKGAETAKKEWLKWAGSAKCDFYGNMNFYGLQKLGFRTMSESGDMLILRRWNENSSVGFDLQLLEADFLDETLTRPTETGGWVMQGVQFDAEGRKEGYWIHMKHPNDVNSDSQTSQFVPAKDMIHAFEVIRPGQVRGIPAGVASFIRLKDFDEFQDAELYKQKVASLFVMVIKQGSAMPGMASATIGKDYNPIDKMEPGMIETLPAGYEANFSQPPNVSGSNEYNSTILHSIAAGYDIPYEDLTGDYSKVTFSSARMSATRFADTIEGWQDNIMISMVCDRVHEWFIEGLAFKKGIFIDPVTSWTTPRRALVDPLKEVNAMVKLIDSRLVSRQESIRQLGGDPDDVNAEIDEDLKLDKKLSDKYEVDVGSFVRDVEGAEPVSGAKPKAPVKKTTPAKTK